MLISKLIPAFLFSLILVSSSYAQPLATFDGGEIQNSEVQENGAIHFYEFEMRRQELTQQILVGILRDKLIAIEEKKSKKKYNDLVIEYIDKEYDKDNAAKFKILFKSDSLKAPEDESTEDHGAVKYEIENKYLVFLIKKYNVKFNLDRPNPPILNINIKNQPFWGAGNASVVIVEFGDFECPYCKKMQSDIQKIRNEYSNKIKWVFIDFPLEFHHQSLKAHIAARCAGDQNRYFEYQQLLFLHSPELSEKTLLSSAATLKLNSDKFSKCLADKNADKQNDVNANVEYGRKMGISGTPTLFINGKYYPGMLEYQDLKDIIDREL